MYRKAHAYACIYTTHISSTCLNPRWLSIIFVKYLQIASDHFCTSKHQQIFPWQGKASEFLAHEKTICAVNHISTVPVGIVDQYGAQLICPSGQRKQFTPYHTLQSQVPSCLISLMSFFPSAQVARASRDLPARRSPPPRGTPSERLLACSSAWGQRR